MIYKALRDLVSASVISSDATYAIFSIIIQPGPSTSVWNTLSSFPAQIVPFAC